MGCRKTDPAIACHRKAGWADGTELQCLPRESAGPRRHRKHPPTRRRQVQGAIDTHFFHQRNIAPRRAVYRGYGQGHRPLSQGLTRVFWPGFTPTRPSRRGYLFLIVRKDMENHARFLDGSCPLERADSFSGPTPIRAIQVPEWSSESFDMSRPGERRFGRHWKAAKIVRRQKEP